MRVCACRTYGFWPVIVGGLISAPQVLVESRARSAAVWRHADLCEDPDGVARAVPVLECTRLGRCKTDSLC